MKSLTLNLPQVKPLPEGRPRACPKCHGFILQRWGKVKKSLKDLKLQEVTVYRYRRLSCSKTFRYYPEVQIAKTRAKGRSSSALFSWGWDFPLMPSPFF